MLGHQLPISPAGLSEGSVTIQPAWRRRRHLLIDPASARGPSRVKFSRDGKSIFSRRGVYGSDSKVGVPLNNPLVVSCVTSKLPFRALENFGVY